MYRPKPSHKLITQEGYPLIAAAIVIAVISILFEWRYITLSSIFVALFTCYFFRNPRRKFPGDHHDEMIISPADGRIVAIETGNKNELMDGPTTKISVFMSLFNCHVNRLPVSGFVEKVIYSPGNFFVASRNKASEKNEKNTVVIRDKKGRRLVVVQIAGFIARRIVSYLKEGLEVTAGSRLGVICFGSRVDFFLPGDLELYIKMGDRVKAGKTVIGRWR